MPQTGLQTATGKALLGNSSGEEAGHEGQGAGDPEGKSTGLARDGADHF